MAPKVRSNDQSLLRIRWVQTGYLKFSAKGTKREVFRMPIPGSLITADLREASYYQEYLANVVKYRWSLSGEPARKPNPTAQKVRIHILQYLIHLRMCKDVPTKMMKMFLLVENLRRENPDNRKVSVQKDNTHGTSANTKFAKQSIVGNLPKVGETHALSKPVTSNSITTPQESKVVKNDKVIAPGMFRIHPFKTSREEKHVPNNVRASIRTKPIIVSQPSVFTKKDVNSDLNGLSSTGIDNTKTRRPQPRSNTKNDIVLSGSTSSCNKNKGVEEEEHHRNLLLSKNKKHMLSVCNNIKLDSHNVISKVFCAMCKQCLISVNHDVCLSNYVNGKTSRGKKQKANVSIREKQKKQQPKVKKTKKVGLIEKLATTKPSKPRFFLRWSPTGRLFDLKGKIIASSKSKSQSDCSNGDNVCTSNTLEPKIKRFLNSTSFLGMLSKSVYGVSTRVVPST
nr:hypothetical protein [Tanacetum cinerariifolium]